MVQIVQGTFLLSDAEQNISYFYQNRKKLSQFLDRKYLFYKQRFLVFIYFLDVLVSKKTLEL